MQEMKKKCVDKMLHKVALSINGLNQSRKLPESRMRRAQPLIGSKLNTGTLSLPLTQASYNFLDCYVLLNMFKSKKEVDKHVTDILRKIKNQNEVRHSVHFPLM